MMKLELGKNNDALAFVGVYEDSLPTTPAILNSTFKGKIGDVLVSHAEKKAYVGMGSLDDLNELRLRKIGGIIGTALKGSRLPAGAISLDGNFNDDNNSAVAIGAMLKAYEFDKYKAEKAPEQILFADISEACFERVNHIIDAVFMARDLTGEPSNVLSTTEFVKRINGLSDLPNVTVEISDAAALERMGANLTLAVGAGSKNPPYIVVMKYAGRPDSNAIDLALVGKGLCFDSGGISLKPGDGMGEMKVDMAGAATVVSAVSLLPRMGIKKNIVGIVGLAENIPDANAYRPGDILTSMTGKTVEVVNTDAEGRLVLADCLTIAAGMKPAEIVDFATLTGAAMVALGHAFSAVFANDDCLCDRLIAAGLASGERLWRMPLDKEYADIIKSDVADIVNCGPRHGAASTAAEFLHAFVPDGQPWAHIDMSGGPGKKGTDVVPTGVASLGVELVERLVRE